MMDIKTRLFINQDLITKRQSYWLCSKLKLTYIILNLSLSAFLHVIKISGYRIGIKFHKDPLAVEQNNYLTKIVNVYIVYDLDARPIKPTNKFKFESCLFGVTSVVNSSDKEKCVYSGYGIIFDRFMEFW